MIKRIDNYSDPRFSQRVLYQHGGFVVDEEPYEVEIISCDTAVVRGLQQNLFQAVIKEFRFYTPHITHFQTECGVSIMDYPDIERICIPIEQIQPSQFYVDEEKVRAVETFINCEQDIIIQVMREGCRYISLDGHTRLYIAASHNFSNVYAVESESDEWIFDFVSEAKRRGILSPKNLRLLGHNEYEEKWNSYCDSYFADKKGR